MNPRNTLNEANREWKPPEQLLPPVSRWDTTTLHRLLHAPCPPGCGSDRAAHAAAVGGFGGCLKTTKTVVVLGLALLAVNGTSHWAPAQEPLSIKELFTKSEHQIFHARRYEVVHSRLCPEGRLA
jgi:hypothetical protein